MTIAIIGIDLGKSVCSVVGLDEAGAVVLRRRMRRQSVIELGVRLPRTVFAMEAWLAGAFDGAHPGRPGARGAADVAGVCPALREGAEERP
jgi:hypothetical protein